MIRVNVVVLRIDVFINGLCYWTFVARESLVVYGRSRQNVCSLVLFKQLDQWLRESSRNVNLSTITEDL